MRFFEWHNSLLIQTLLIWMNDVLEERRLIVRDIVEDMYDGQVLGELLGKVVLARDRLRV